MKGNPPSGYRVVSSLQIETRRAYVMAKVWQSVRDPGLMFSYSSTGGDQA